MRPGLHDSWKITNKTPWFGTGWHELVRYKDLLYRMVRKDILLYYQQTLLGPLWMVLQPLLTVLAYVVIFDKVIGLPTEGVPSFLFYLTGITLWNLFSDVFTGVSTTFAQNVQVFSKVYFPRIIAPIATTLVHTLRFVIQFLFLVVVLVYYNLSGKYSGTGNWLLIFPAFIITAGMAFGAGLIFSVLTVAYRDLNNFQQLLIRLLMFLCPIFYSLSMIDEEKRWLVNVNPLSPLFEMFRAAILNKGIWDAGSAGYSLLCTGVLIVSGLLLFNKKSDRLVDVI